MPVFNPSQFLQFAAFVLAASLLLRVWYTDRRQRFARDMSLACLAQAALVPLLMLNPPPPADWLGTPPMTWPTLLTLIMAVLLAGSGLLRLVFPALDSTKTWLLGWILGLNWLAILALISRWLQVDWWHSTPQVLAWASTLLLLRWAQLQLGTLRILLVLGSALLLNLLHHPEWPAHWGDRQSLESGICLALGLAMIWAMNFRIERSSLRLSNTFEQMAARSHQGMAVFSDEQVLYANTAFRRMFGFGAQELKLRQEFVDLAPVAEHAQIQQRHRYLMDDTAGLAELTYEAARHHKDGQTLHLRISEWHTEWNGLPAVQVVVTDNSAQRLASDAMQKLHYQATHDELTGLPKRSELTRRLGQLCQAQSPPFTLMVLDIDRFKLFNVAHGHAMGDAVLNALSLALQDTYGHSAEIMRLELDDFALIATLAADEENANRLAGQIQERLTRPLLVNGSEFFLDVSIGLALYPQSAKDPDGLVRAAYAARARAKVIAGTSCVLANPAFEQNASVLLEQEQALRYGLRNHEFKLAYQPKIDARTRQLSGFEALARWQRPNGQNINPTEFIGTAERTGLITELGEYFLNLACAQLADWCKSHGHLVPVAVNVSPLQLLNRDFPQHVAQALARWNVPAQLLTLEITESAAVENMDLVRQQVIQLRELGVEVAMDDFGTGFSSLNLLRNLPLSVLKIDRSLITPMPAPDAVAVVRAICQLANAMQLRVVAEGVENMQQAMAASEAGCHELQGYLFSRPLKPEQIDIWLDEARSQSGLMPLH